MGLGVIRFELERPIVVLNGLLELSILKKNKSQNVVGLGVFGMDFQFPVVLGNRIVHPHFMEQSRVQPGLRWPRRNIMITDKKLVKHRTNVIMPLGGPMSFALFIRIVPGLKEKLEEKQIIN